MQECVAWSELYRRGTEFPAMAGGCVEQGRFADSQTRESFQVPSRTEVKVAKGQGQWSVP